MFGGNDYLTPDEREVLDAINAQYAPPANGRPGYTGAQVAGAPANGRPGYTGAQVAGAPSLLGLDSNGRPVYAGVQAEPSTSLVTGLAGRPDYIPSLSYAPETIFYPRTGEDFQTKTNSGAVYPFYAKEDVPMGGDILSPNGAKNNAYNPEKSLLAGVNPAYTSEQMQRLATLNRQFDNSEAIASRNMSRYGLPAIADYDKDLAIARATATSDTLNRYAAEAAAKAERDAAVAQAQARSGGGSGGFSSGGGASSRPPATPFRATSDPLGTGTRTPSRTIAPINRPLAAGVGSNPAAPRASANPAAPRAGVNPAAPRAGVNPASIATAVSGIRQLVGALLGKGEETRLQNLGLIKYVKDLFGNEKAIAMNPDGSVRGEIAATDANGIITRTYNNSNVGENLSKFEGDDDGSMETDDGGSIKFNDDGTLSRYGPDGMLVETLQDSEYEFDDEGNLVINYDTAPPGFEADLNEFDYFAPNNNDGNGEFELPAVELPPYVPPPEIDPPEGDPEPYVFD